MTAKRTMPAGLIPVGYQKLICSNTAVRSLNSTMRGASVLMIGVETANVRVRFDGSPARTTGILLLTTNSPYWVEGYNGTAKLRFHKAIGATGTVRISGFKRPGE